jgi:hypothetical protein
MLEDIQKEHEILQTFNGKVCKMGRFAGEEKNKYWLVKNKETNEEYYIMNCGDNMVKIDIDSIKKVVNVEKAWFFCKNGYVSTDIDDKQITMYAYLMDYIGNGKTKDALTVSHINQNKLDNRLSNLKITTHSEQNQLVVKRNRRSNAKSLPDGIQQSDLPKYVTYNAEYKKDDNGERVLFRDYFRIEKHPKLGDTIWTTSKSKAYTIRQKLQQAIDHLDVLNRMDTNETAIHDI